MRWKFLILVFCFIVLIGIIPGISKGISSSDSTKFTITPSNACANAGSVWYDENKIAHYTLMEGEEFCAMGATTQGDIQGTGCCPVGYECKIDNDDTTAGCQLGGIENPCINKATCSDYETQAECGADSCRLGVARGRGFGTDICGQVVCYEYDGQTLCRTIREDSCKCAWHDGQCKLDYNIIESLVKDNPFGFLCSKYFTGDDCVNNKMHITWRATPPPPTGISDAELDNAQCIDGEGDITCGQPLIKLKFFTTASLIIAILLLVIFYAIIIKKKKKFAKEKKYKGKKGKKRK